MANTKQHPSLGRMPRAATGKCGPGMGTMPGSVDNTRGMNPTASAGGKGHPSLGPGGSHESYKNAPRDFPSLGGKLNKVADKW